MLGPSALELDDEALIERLLDELDEMFEGQTRQHFIKAVVQNWSQQPFIRGAYPTSIEGDESSAIAALAAPVDGRLFFAGTALDEINMSTVHGAMQSAYRVVEQILADRG